MCVCVCVGEGVFVCVCDITLVDRDYTYVHCPRYTRGTRGVPEGYLANGAARYRASADGKGGGLLLVLLVFGLHTPGLASRTVSCITAHDPPQKSGDMIGQSTDDLIFGPLRQRKTPVF